MKDYSNPAEEQPLAPETAKPGNQPSQAHTSRIGLSKEAATEVASWGDIRNSRQMIEVRFASVSLPGAHIQPVSWTALPKGRGAREITGPPQGTDLATVVAKGGTGTLGATADPVGYKAPDFELNTTKTGADWISKPTLKMAAFEGTAPSYYTKAGKYKTDRQEGGKDVYWSFSDQISDLIKTGEQEHCDDDAEAYRISLKEAGTILDTHIVGKSFGPKATQAEAEGLVLAEITAKLTHTDLGNDKTQWAAKFRMLSAKSLIRDTSGWHTLSRSARSVDSAGNITYEWGSGTSKIPGPPSSAIIKY